jgi:hypothetical protein
MNWKELRPVLRKEFGRDFYFYNDQYKSGTRRIKIRTMEPQTMVEFLNTNYPELDAKIYVAQEGWIAYNRKSVTIHYR